MLPKREHRERRELILLYCKVTQCDLTNNAKIILFLSIYVHNILFRIITHNFLHDIFVDNILLPAKHYEIYILNNLGHYVTILFFITAVNIHNMLSLTLSVHLSIIYVYKCK